MWICTWKIDLLSVHLHNRLLSLHPWAPGLGWIYPSNVSLGGTVWMAWKSPPGVAAIFTICRIYPWAPPRFSVPLLLNGGIRHLSLLSQTEWDFHTFFPPAAATMEATCWNSRGQNEPGPLMTMEQNCPAHINKKLSLHSMLILEALCSCCPQMPFHFFLFICLGMPLLPPSLLPWLLLLSTMARTTPQLLTRSTE